MSEQEPLVVWEDPPRAKHLAPRAERVLAELRANPGRWALIARTSRGLQIAPWWSEVVAAADIEWESVSEGRVPTGQLFPPRRIYARCVEKKEGGR